MDELIKARMVKTETVCFVSDCFARQDKLKMYDLELQALRQYQKPTDTKILDAIDKLTYARDSDREFDDGTFVEALDTALACMRQMRSDPCEVCGNIEILSEENPFPAMDSSCKIVFFENDYVLALGKIISKGSGINFRFSEPIFHCPNCGKELVK